MNKKIIILLFIFCLFSMNIFSQMSGVVFEFDGRERSDLVQIALWDIALRFGNNHENLLSWISDEDKNAYGTIYNRINSMIEETVLLPELAFDNTGVAYQHILERAIIIRAIKARIDYPGYTPPNINMPNSFTFNLNQNFSIIIGFNNDIYLGLSELALWDYAYHLVSNRYGENTPLDVPLFTGLNTRPDMENYVIVYKIIYLIMSYEQEDELKMNLKTLLEEYIRQRAYLFLRN